MRSLRGHALIAALLESRQYTKALIDDLTDAQWRVPVLATINPVLWEIGHVGWFMERWCLRGGGNHQAASLIDDADRLYDSSAINHADRWTLPLPSRMETLLYVDRVLEAVRDAIERGGDSDEQLYPFRLALYHEDMHAESFAQLRQTLGYPPPANHAFLTQAASACPGEGDAVIEATEFQQGVAAGLGGFVFDNEKWAHPVRLQPFALARRPVSEGEFLAFVEDGGYRRAELWSVAGRAWQLETGTVQPTYWRRSEGAWEQRVFDRWEPLHPSAPMTHVTAYEAEAYCAWAGRRLPTEAEWEYAALNGAIAWGDSVWEWTASPFAPYPGFRADAYRDYSEPWFHTHRSVRGGSKATPRRLVDPKFRNFYCPHRNDIFVGFRTAAH